LTQGIFFRRGQVGARAMTHLAVRRPSMRGSLVTETVADMQVGDMGETIIAMNVRSEVDYKSEIVGSLHDGTKFVVVETAESHRALISAGNITGWISTKTDLDQPLTRRLQVGNGYLDIYDNLVGVTVRQDMEFKSPEVLHLIEGTEFEMIEEGSQHRCKILVDGLIGWITAKTDLDQPLIRKKHDVVPTKLSKNLDTYVVRVASQAQVTKVLSSKSMGRGVERSMSNMRSNASVDAGKPALKQGQPQKVAKPPPKMSKMACCCG